jgi:hypothetical protein
MTDTNQRQLGNTLWQQGQGTIFILGWLAGGRRVGGPGLQGDVVG